MTQVAGSVTSLLKLGGAQPSPASQEERYYIFPIRIGELAIGLSLGRIAIQLRSWLVFVLALKILLLLDFGHNIPEMLQLCNC